MANVTGSFTATGQSATFAPRVGERLTQSGQFNVALTGTAVATVQLERSFDNGVTWTAIYAGGTQLYSWSYSSGNLSESAEECEPGVIYRLNCTAYTSGTLTYRISGAA
jgi:hypothetical protein